MTNGGYIANFLSNGIHTNIVYDDQGRWFYNLLSFTDANLTLDIKDVIKSKYFNNEIIVVYQYEFYNKAVCIARMYDQQLQDNNNKSF
jgi:hypothetical protein